VVLTGDFSYPNHCDNLCCTLAALGFKVAFDPHTPTHVRGGKLDWVLLRGCRERPRVSLGRQERDRHQLVVELRQALPLPPTLPLPRYRRLGLPELTDFHVLSFFLGGGLAAYEKRRVRPGTTPGTPPTSV
jgi:hypothetical protein